MNQMNHHCLITLHITHILSKTHKITDHMATLIYFFHPVNLALLQHQHPMINFTKKNDEIDINGITYRRVNTLYCYSKNITKTWGALLRIGFNGRLAGDDVRSISKTSRTVNVQGIDNHQCANIQIVTARAVTRSQRRHVIIIMNQYAYVMGGKTIHSSGKMEAFNNDVNDKSIKVLRGTQ